MGIARNIARLIPNGSGVLSDANAPSGSVIQVVQTTATPTFLTTSTSFVDYPSASVTITPSSSSSRILLLFNFHYYLELGGSDNGFRCQILRNSTVIFVENNHSTYIYSPDSTEFMTRYYVSQVDSPATTSAITYKLQVACTAGSRVNNYDNNPLSVIAMEIAA